LCGWQISPKRMAVSMTTPNASPHFPMVGACHIRVHLEFTMRGDEEVHATPLPQPLPVFPRKFPP
jgi:hypothetical protein